MSSVLWRNAKKKKRLFAFRLPLMLAACVMLGMYYARARTPASRSRRENAAQQAPIPGSHAYQHGYYGTGTAPYIPAGREGGLTKSYQRARRSLHVAPATESHAIAFNCRFVGCMHLGFVGSIEPKPNLCSRQGVTLSPISCASPVRRALL